MRSHNNIIVGAMVSEIWYRSLVFRGRMTISKLHEYAKTRRLAMSNGSRKLPKLKRKTGAQSTRDYLLAQRIDLASSGKCSGILHGEGVLVQETLVNLFIYVTMGKASFLGASPHTTVFHN